MTPDDDKFFAWLDGELSGDEAAAMEAKVAVDPQLASLAKQHRALGLRLRSAFGEIAEAPVPDRLAASVRKPRTGIFRVDWAARRPDRPPWSPLPQWAAMAATLAIGILVGTMVRQPSSAPVELQGGGIYAAAALDEALDTQLASAPTGGDLRIGLTFRDQAGAVCRSFTAREASGLACREGERWGVRGLFAPLEGQASDYRMASGMDPNLAALMDSTMAGQPFDDAQERAAKQRGWK